MTIQWIGKGREFDVHNVVQVWFDKSRVYYTIAGEPGAESAKVKDIERIVGVL